jgi:hypothetical protein
MTGLPRAPVAIPDPPGRIAVDLPEHMRFELRAGLPDFAIATVFNPSDETWPGLDIQTEGLVLLRYRFFDSENRLVLEGTAGFDRDLPGVRTVSARALVEPPNREGRFRVLFDLVQQWDGAFHDLGFEPYERSVSGTERKRRPGSSNDS